MISIYFAVCSERAKKPVVRAVFDSPAEAEAGLEGIRERDGHDPEDAYWVAEVGKEAESWLRFFLENANSDPH